MANPRATITQAEMTRYLKAYRDAGVPIARTEISKDGKIVIITADESISKINNDWDAK